TDLDPAEDATLQGIGYGEILGTFFTFLRGLYSEPQTIVKALQQWAAATDKLQRQTSLYDPSLIITDRNHLGGLVNNAPRQPSCGQQLLVTLLFTEVGNHHAERPRAKFFETLA